MTVHDLKIYPEFWEDIATGKKTFEVRKNDRDYHVGDILLMRKFDPAKNNYLNFNEVMVCDVTYVVDLAKIGIEGYVGMQIKPRGILKKVEENE